MPYLLGQAQITIVIFRNFRNFRNCRNFRRFFLLFLALCCTVYLSSPPHCHCAPSPFPLPCPLCPFPIAFPAHNPFVVCACVAVMFMWQAIFFPFRSLSPWAKRRERYLLPKKRTQEQRRVVRRIIIVRRLLQLSEQPSTLVSLKIVMMLCGVSAATFQSAMTTRILQELISKVTILPSAPVAFPMCLHYNFLLIYLWSISQSVSQSTNLPISPFVCSFLGLKHALKSKSAVSLPFGPSVAQDLNTPSSPSGAPVTRPEIIANINADATAAFLGCGIPLEKLDHPSMRGFLKKYTQIEDCLSGASTLRKDNNILLVYGEHSRAIRRRLTRDGLRGVPHAWLSFDEWTDDYGNAIVDILVGHGSNGYVVETATLQCMGPNSGTWCALDVHCYLLVRSEFDPKQLPLRDTTWEKNKEIFGFSDTMRADWELYVNMDSQKAKQVEDPMQFWSALSGPPSELVVALLGMPVTSADVERSFSLAGLLDDPNRGNTRPDLRRCAVALFVNGDVEGRF